MKGKGRGGGEEGAVSGRVEGTWGTHSASENGQNVSFSAVLLFHFNGTVGSPGTLMPLCPCTWTRARDRPSGRARDQKTGEGIIYRKWVVRRSGVI